MDDYESHLDAKQNLLAGKVNKQEAQVGVFFMHEELISRLGKEHQRTATKTSRLEKWKRMI